jgi:hypothetical protein
MRYKNALVMFRMESSPMADPSLTTPPEACEVTRSEVLITESRITVEVWLEPASPAEEVNPDDGS